MSRSGDGRFDKPLYAHEPILTAENRLWRAVLQQAYEDAEQPQMTDGLDPEMRARAQRYLRADPGVEIDQLKLVCDFAQVPFDRVVSFARNRYAFVPPPPAEASLLPRRKTPRSERASHRRKAARRARRASNAAAAPIVQEQNVELVS